MFFSSRVGMQLSQVLTPSQRKERFLSVQRRRQVNKHLLDNLFSLLISILLLSGKRSINIPARPGEGREHNKRARC